MDEAQRGNQEPNPMTIHTITFDDATHVLVPRHVVSEAASAFADLGWHESLARAKELLAAAPMAESQGDRITEATTMQTARLIEMGQLATVDPDGQRADYQIGRASCRERVCQ